MTEDDYTSDCPKDGSEDQLTVESFEANKADSGRRHTNHTTRKRRRSPGHELDAVASQKCDDTPSVAPAGFDVPIHSRDEVIHSFWRFGS